MASLKKVGFDRRRRRRANQIVRSLKARLTELKVRLTEAKVRLTESISRLDPRQHNRRHVRRWAHRGRSKLLGRAHLRH